MYSETLKKPAYQPKWPSFTCLFKLSKWILLMQIFFVFCFLFFCLFFLACSWSFSNRNWESLRRACLWDPVHPELPVRTQPSERRRDPGPVPPKAEVPLGCPRAEQDHWVPEAGASLLCFVFGKESDPPESTQPNPTQLKPCRLVFTTMWWRKSRARNRALKCRSPQGGPQFNFSQSLPRPLCLPGTTKPEPCWKPSSCSNCSSSTDLFSTSQIHLVPLLFFLSSPFAPLHPRHPLQTKKKKKKKKIVHSSAENGNNFTKWCYGSLSLTFLFFCFIFLSLFVFLVLRGTDFSPSSKEYRGPTDLFSRALHSELKSQSRWIGFRAAYRPLALEESLWKLASQSTPSKPEVRRGQCLWASSNRSFPSEEESTLAERFPRSIYSFSKVLSKGVHKANLPAGLLQTSILPYN